MSQIVWAGAINKDKYAKSYEYIESVSECIKKGFCFIVLPDGYFVEKELLIFPIIKCLISGQSKLKQEWIISSYSELNLC